MLTNNAFTYDMVGNRLSKQQNSSQSNALVAGSFNNLNQLTALSGGNGKLQVSGTVSKISKVTVLSGTNSYPATALWGTNFSASIAASLGTNTFTVVAQDANTNLVTNTYQIAVTALEGSRSFIYDANGNCLSDGQRSYQWDAENRLASVTVGTNVYAFGYDYAGRRVKESLNGTLIKQTLWDRAGNSPTPLEERNAANAVAKRFFAQGEQQNGTNYYYLRDHLGSVREMVTGSGQIVSEATYDPYGVATVSGTVTPTFQYAGYYAHQGSGLNLTWYRSYDPVIGRWQARDPLPNAERLQGPNLYSYVKNRDLNLRDPFGLEGAEGFGIPENPAPQSPWDPRVSDQGRQNYSCALQKQQQHVGEYFSGVSALGLGVIALNVAPTALGYALTNPEGALNWLYFSGSAFALTPPGPYENIGDALGDTAHHLWDWLNDQEKGRNESNRNCANKCNN